MEERLVPRYSVCYDYLLTGAALVNAEGRVLGIQQIGVIARVHDIYAWMGIIGQGRQLWSGSWCWAQRVDDI